MLLRNGEPTADAANLTGLLWGSRETKDRRVLCNIKLLCAQILSGLGYLQMAYAIHWLSMSASLLCFSTDPRWKSWPGWVSGGLLTAYPFTPSSLPTEIQFYLLSQQPSAWNGAGPFSTRRQGQGDREQDMSPDWSKPITAIPLPLSVTDWNMDMRHNSDQWT